MSLTLEALGRLVLSYGIHALRQEFTRWRTLAFASARPQSEAKSTTSACGVSTSPSGRRKRQ